MSSALAATPLAAFSAAVLCKSDMLAGARQGLAEEIEGLGAHSADRNVFYEWWAIESALHHLRDGEPLFLLIRSPEGVLTGLMPFEHVGSFRGLPIPVLRSWRHRYCFLCTPLVHRDHIEGTMAALVDWLGSPAAPAKLFELSMVHADSVFAQHLRLLTGRSRAFSHYEDAFERAEFQPEVASDAEISGKHRKEMRRLERRLSEKGALAYTRWSDQDELPAWIDEFLALEASGWKGRLGEAFVCIPGDREFFTHLVGGAGKRGQLQLLALRLDGRAIAMKCNFLSPSGSFSFKIAFDETYASYSPGVLLELYNMRDLREHYPAVAWMDSCAAEKHFMANRLWPGRRRIGRHILAHGLSARSVMRAGQGFVFLRRHLTRQVS